MADSIIKSGSAANLNITVIDHTLGASYTTGGELVGGAPDSSKVLWAVIDRPATTGGYEFEYDRTTNRLKAFQVAATPAGTVQSHKHNLTFTGGQAAGNALQYLGTVIGSTVAGNVTDTAAVGNTAPLFTGTALATPFTEVAATTNLSAVVVRLAIWWAA